MQITQEISKNIFWLGGSDNRLERFENIHPLPMGVSYNSYLIQDEKVALLDTVDYSIAKQFLKNIDKLMGGRAIDYLVLNHVEPDHCASIQTLCNKYPNIQLVGNQKTQQLLTQFLHFDTPPNFKLVQEKDELNLGSHSLRFYFAPMVHWPEVMFTYETSQGILFSADAFGTFGALPGNIFSDEMDFEADFLDEARRYYSNIVGKYGPQVQAILKKVAEEKLNMICPLHGPIWRKNLDYYLGKYHHWSKYEPEVAGVLIVHGSMYGNTEQAASGLANLLSQKGIQNIHSYDVSATHHSYLISEAFKYSHIVFAAPTYNLGLFLPMYTFIHDMTALNMQNRKVAIIGNGSWAPASHTIMKKMLTEGMKNMELLAEPLLLRSTITRDQLPELEAMADAIASSVKETAVW
ncbi:MAG: FprA family A-type flavoprotein [Oscillospiraceae bacterium]